MTQTKLIVLFLITIIFQAISANAATIISVTSTEDGMRIDYKGYKEIVYFKHDKEDGFTRSEDDWSNRGIRSRPTENPGEYYFLDKDVKVSRHYCYRILDRGQRFSVDSASWPKCGIYYGSGPITWPKAVTEFKIKEITPNTMTFQFNDQSDNEGAFFLEQEDPLLSSFPNTKPSWRVKGIENASPGVGRQVIMDDALSLDMEQKYCFRIRAINNEGSSLSNMVCGRTSTVDVFPQVDVGSYGVRPISLTHPSINSLKLTWFDTFDEHNARAMLLYEMDNFEDVATFQLYDIRNARNRLLPSFIFENLDPEKTYCAIIVTVFPPIFNDNISICESPFAEKESISNRSALTPVIRKVRGGANEITIELKGPRPGQLVDLIEKDTGIRRTIRKGNDGRSRISIRVSRVGEYCVRMFNANKYGTSYGKMKCIFVFTQGGGTGHGTGTGGGTGGGTIHPNKIDGTDCNCSLTGQFVNPVTPSSGNASTDGVYRVSRINNSLAVFRNSDNLRVFHTTSFNTSGTYGFGPNSRYFFLATQVGLNTVTVTVHDLEGPPLNNRVFFLANVSGSSGWGFSPDGRIFMLASNISTTNSIISLVNLQTRQPPKVLSSINISSAFWQFSQCGDAFVVVSNTSLNSPITLSLYSTIDLKKIKTITNINPNYSGIATNNTSHVINISNSSPATIAPNTAQQSCQIPIRNGNIYDLQVARLSGANINPSEASNIFNGSTQLLKTSNSDDDIACDVTLNKVGNILNNSTISGNINTPAALSAAFNSPGQVKVATEINFCSEMRPGILGCAPVPGGSFIFVRHNEEVETVVHEFAHNRGLDHVENDSTNLMSDFPEENAVNINQQQCNAFLGISSSSMTSAFNQLNTSLLPIEAFVRRTYYHGVPYEDVQQYDTSIIPVLLKMLSTRDEYKHWSNIVVTLGMLGDDKAVEPLIDFIEGKPYPDNQQYQTSRKHALMSLGYLLKKNDHKPLLNYLKQKATQNVVETGRLKDNILFSDIENTFEFRKYAILALGLAGTKTALDVLIELQKPENSQQGQIFRSQYAGLVRSSIEENKKISKLGYHNYYDSSPLDRAIKIE